VLFNITGGMDLTLNEINEAADLINQAADPEANIIFGAVINPEMQGEVKITLIATGFDQRQPPQHGSAERPRPLRPMPPDLEDERYEPRPRQRMRDRQPAFEDEDDLDVPPFLRGRPQR
jgi:cell division protein FtsZ